jgi:fatty acid desaturase
LQSAVPACTPIVRALSFSWLPTALCIFFRLATPIYSFIALPLLDAILGEEEEPALKVAPSIWYKPMYYGFCHVFALLQLAAIVGGAYVVTQPGSSPLLLLLVILNLGCVGGFAFAVAHELVHSKRQIHRACGDLILTLLCYKHWSLSHMAHHAQVATQNDPASARYHENVRHSCALVLGTRLHHVMIGMLCIWTPHCLSCM